MVIYNESESNGNVFHTFKPRGQSEKSGGNNIVSQIMLATLTTTAGTGVNIINFSTLCFRSLRLTNRVKTL